MKIVLITVCVLLAQSNAADIDAYWNDRANFIQSERGQFLGSQIQLTPAEEVANNILMAAKNQEFTTCFDPLCFPPARHFFLAKNDIEQSQVFSIIKQMPKGAALHGHDTGMVSTDWIVQNITYRSGLYTCTRTSSLNPLPPLGLDLLRTLFASSTPNAASCSEGSWRNVENMRATMDPTEVDQWFYHHFSLYTDNPLEKYPDVNVAWSYFSNLFDVVGGMLSYTPVFRDYYVQTLQEFLDDNVQYIELRGLLLPTYNLDGSSVDSLALAALYQDASAEFLAAHNPGDWFGSRFIYAPSRSTDNATVDQYVDLTVQLIQNFPDFIAGFDMVGQEEKGRPYIDFINQLLRLRDLVPDIKFFFHAGETNWEGLTDMNIIDAILLNTTRIGHGYAITKHPLAQQLAKDRGIAIEVNPVSNQVLGLVDDLRNHPVASLLAIDFPVVVSCDDPSFWGAKGLSYDYYQMFMGLAGIDADLRFLKQLALNSLTYSAMEAEEKACAIEAWQIKWDTFISNISGIKLQERELKAPCVHLWSMKYQLQTNNICSGSHATKRNF